MDSSSVESARRKARRLKALEEDLKATAEAPPREVPGAVIPLRPLEKPPAGTAPAAGAVARKSGVKPIAGAGAARAGATGRGKPVSAARKDGRSAVRSKTSSALSRVHIPANVAGLKANEERLLLESRELDLFGTGVTGKVAICPDCQHEIVRVICLGVAIRACLECKGVWFSYANVREFSRDNEWFQNLTPAIQLEIDKRERSQ